MKTKRQLSVDIINTISIASAICLQTACSSHRLPEDATVREPLTPSTVSALGFSPQDVPQTSSSCSSQLGWAPSNPKISTVPNQGETTLRWSFNADLNQSFFVDHCPGTPLDSRSVYCTPYVEISAQLKAESDDGAILLETPATIKAYSTKRWHLLAKPPLDANRGTFTIETAPEGKLNYTFFGDYAGGAVGKGRFGLEWNWDHTTTSKQNTMTHFGASGSNAASWDASLCVPYSPTGPNSG